MYGNKVFIATNDMRMIALNRDSGELAWEVQARAPTDPATGTPSARTQGVHGRAAGDQDRAAARNSSSRARAPAASSAPGAGSAPSTPTPGSWHGAPSPSRPRASPARRPGRTITMPGGSAAAACGRPRPTIRRPTLLYYGTGDAFPSFDPRVPPGRQPLHRQHHRARRRYRQDRVVLPGDAERALGLRHAEPEDALRGRRSTARPRKVVANFSRNGFFYTLDRTSGQFLRADQYQEKVTWTKGIDPEDRQAGRLRSAAATCSSMPASAACAASPDRSPARGTTARRPSSRRPSIRSA